MKQTSFFDDGEAERLRDEGLDKVGSHNEDWMGLALSKLNSHPRNVEVTGEELKVWLLKNGLPNPKHHNAWGCLVRLAASAGLIEPTGRACRMRLAKSHARVNPIWYFKV